MIDIEDEIETTAQTAYGEDRSGGEEGMAGVVCVIMNRVQVAKAYVARRGKRHPLFGDGTFADCCLRPAQFDCWDPQDANYRIIINVSDTDPLFIIARKLATDAVNGRLIDSVCAATYYYAKSMRRPPYWAKGKKPCADRGGQLYFNNI